MVFPIEYSPNHRFRAREREREIWSGGILEMANTRTALEAELVLVDCLPSTDNGFEFHADYA